MFAWTPGEADIGTNVITVYVEDAPDTGAPAKSDSRSFVIVVTSAGSAPVPASMDFSSSGIMLSWAAATNRTYRVQYKDDLNATNWTDVADITATNSAMSLPLNVEVFQRYYRVLSVGP